MYRQFLFTTITLLSFLTSNCFAQNYNLSDTVVTTCSGNFYDDGGPAGNYGLNQSHTMTFHSGNGNRLQFVFNSLITVYGLNVYDGATTSSPLIGTYGSGIAPFTVQSTGTSLTFQFTSGNIAAQSNGWVATISCTTPPLDIYPLSNGQTITACEGVFYDDGGPDSVYSGTQTSVMTFCPGSPNHYLVFHFPYQFTLGLGDTLFVYSGNSTSTPPLGVYAGDNLYAYISSPQPGECLTFKFTSDGFDNSFGWQGIIACNATPVYTMNMISGTIPTCSGFFYDSGGPGGNYKPNKSSVVTFTSTSGCAIQADFGSLITTYGLNIYDGTSIAAPLIGSYGTGLAPFTVQSTGSSLTFEFNTGNIIAQSMGWGALFSCPTTTNANVTPGGVATICNYDTLLLTANSAVASYAWNTGDTTQTISVTAAGNYYTTITNNVGCTATSNVVTVVVNPSPAQPTIVQNGNTLQCSPASGYQWYFNGVLIPGASNNIYTATIDGGYTVQITDSNGCSSLSDPYNYSSVGMQETISDKTIHVIPQPNDGRFTLEGIGRNGGKLCLINMMGERVYEATFTDPQIILPVILRGIYILEISSNNRTVFERLVLTD